MREPLLPARGVMWRGVVYCGVALLALGGPLLASQAALPAVEEIFGGYAIFSLLALSGTAGAVVIGGLELRRRAGGGWPAVLPVLLALLVGFQTLFTLSEHRPPVSDYRRYRVAAEDLQAGRNPYLIGGARKYLYPPLVAQTMAATHRGMRGVQRVLGRTPDSERAWLGVFYLYQAGQLLLVLLVYALCVVIGMGLGLGRVPAHLLGAGLVLFSVPLVGTLRHNQVNLLVLDLTLLALWAARRWPLVSGTALGLAAHVKLYPLALALPLWAGRCRRAVLWMAAASVAILLMQTAGGRHWDLWDAYLRFAAESFPNEHESIRNSSLLAVYTTACRAVSDRCVDHFPLLTFLARATGVGLLVWFGWRVVGRLRLTSSVPSEADRQLLVFGAETLAFALLLAPIVWDHHYVLGIPLALAAVALRGRDRPWQAGLGVALLLALPAFGYHRIAGLILLLLLTAPRPALVGLAEEGGGVSAGSPNTG